MVSNDGSPDTPELEAGDRTVSVTSSRRFSRRQPHIAASRPKSLQLRATLVAPEMLRRVYLAARRPMLPPRPAMRDSIAH